MLRKISAFVIFVIITTMTIAHAENDAKIPTSKGYVMTTVETRQDKIPAANQPNADAGETVMTYTDDGNGVIGERGIYTGADSYVESTDADKLITASALNDAFTSLPTTDTTTLECANPGTCSLWTIIDQTAYRKPSKNLFDGTIYNIAYISGHPNTVHYQSDYRGIIVPVSAGKTYTISRQTAIGNRFNWYFASSYPQEGDTAYEPSSRSISALSATVTIPANMSYLVVYFSTSGEDISESRIQVEEGETATSYEPYY